MADDNQINTVDRLYGGALVEMADEAGALDSMAEEVAGLGELLAQSPELEKLLASQVLSAKDRAASIERIFKGKVSDLLFRFLLVVNKKNRLADLPGILRAFGKGFAEKRGVIEVDIHTADALPADKLAGIAQGIGKALNRQVVPSAHVEPHLIGGLKLRIGDQLIDGSVATQLRLMTNRIVAAGRGKAREAVV